MLVIGNPVSFVFKDAEKSKDAGSPMKDVGDDRRALHFHPLGCRRQVYMRDFCALGVKGRWVQDSPPS